MNTYLAWTGTILWWICWPIGILIYYVAITIIAILKLIYWPIAFILQPVVYLLRFIAAILALPFRALVKLEPLYNYVGVAALVGLIGGLVVFYIYSLFHRLLRLDSTSEPAKERTFKQYRQEKAQQKAQVQPAMLPSRNGMVNLTNLNLNNGYSSAASKGGADRNLMDQTIMEEMDSDY